MKPSRWRLAGVWLTMFWLVGVVMFAKHNFALGVLPIVTLWGGVFGRLSQALVYR